jgi:hypothetical protein
VLPNVDGRSALARRYRTICRDVLEAMGVTETGLTGLQRDQVRELAQNQVELDDLQTKAFVEVGFTEKVTLTDSIKALTNTIARQRWQLGINPRRRQDLGPTEDPLDYAASFTAVERIGEAGAK